VPKFWIVFAGIVKLPDEVWMLEAMIWFVEREFGLESSIFRSIVEGSAEVEVHVTMMGCVGSMLVPGVGEVIVRAAARDRSAARAAREM
jgi:hypothetical protein